MRVLSTLNVEWFYHLVILVADTRFEVLLEHLRYDNRSGRRKGVVVIDL